MHNYFIGRQPIFNSNQNVIGYELLYRQQGQSHAMVVDGNQATAQVLMNSFLEMGLDKVVGNHLAFINVTRNFIVSENQLPPPTSQLVLEILENIEIDATVIRSIRKLKQMGYIIALDDFIFCPKLIPLVNEANIIKLDVQALDSKQLGEHVAMLGKFPVQLVAEKIETPEMFDHCKELGFHYYQGYFLCKPRIMSGRRLPASRVNIMRMMAKLQDPEIDIKGLETLIAQDPSMSYKLIRYINSAAFSLTQKLDSIRHAIVYLGEKEIRRWATLISLTTIDDKPDELIKTSLVRGRMCELLSVMSGNNNKDSAFIVGLFSTLDAMLDQPLSGILESLPLTPEITAALLDHTGPYAEVLKRVIAYERGEWDGLEPLMIDADSISDIYLRSLEWADATMQEVKSDKTH